MHVRCFEAWRSEGRSVSSAQSARSHQQIIGLARELWNQAEPATTGVRRLRHEAPQTQIPLDTAAAARAKGVELRRYWRDSVLDSVMQGAFVTTRASAGYIQILEPGAKYPVIRAHKGFRAPVPAYFDPVGYDEAPYTTALKTGRRVIIEAAATGQTSSQSPALKFLLHDDARTVQATPLIGSSGEAFGVLSTHYRDPNQLDSINLMLIDQFAQRAVSIVEWHRRAVANL
jgi:hypothetical protein